MDVKLTDSLCGRDGVIRFWSMLAGPGSDGRPLWAMASAYGARPSARPGCTELLTRAGDKLEWIAVADSEIARFAP